MPTGEGKAAPHPTDVLAKLAEVEFAALAAARKADAEAFAAQEQLRASAASLPVPLKPAPPRGDPDAYEQRAAVYRRERRVADLNIPANYVGARLDSPPPAGWGSDKDRGDWAEISRRLKAFTRDHGIVALLGGRGLGKTHLAWAALVEAATNANRGGICIKCKEMFLRIQAAFNTPNQLGVMDRYIKAGFLVIDEIGEAQTSKEWNAGTLTYIVDKRYDARRPTLLLSNDTRDTFLASIGDSIHSRIEERGRIYVVDWASVREFLAKQRK